MIVSERLRKKYQSFNSENEEITEVLFHVCVEKRIEDKAFEKNYEAKF